MGTFRDSKGSVTRTSDSNGRYGYESYSYDGKISGDTVSDKYGKIEGKIDRNTGKVYDRYGYWTGEYYED